MKCLKFVLMLAMAALVASSASAGSISWSGIVQNVTVTDTDNLDGTVTKVLSVDTGANQWETFTGGFLSQVGGAGFDQSAGFNDPMLAFPFNTRDSAFLTGAPLAAFGKVDTAAQVSVEAFAYSTPFSGVVQLARLTVPEDYAMVTMIDTSLEQIFQGLSFWRGGATVGEVWGSFNGGDDPPEVPEPGLLALLLSGGLGLAALRRRRTA